MATDFEISTGALVVPAAGDRFVLVRQSLGVWSPFSVLYETTLASPSSNSGTSLLAARADHTHANYVPKISGGTAGHVAVLTSDGSIADGGVFGPDIDPHLAPYGMIADGTSHPISAAVANAAYPGLNVPSNTTVERDWAAGQYLFNTAAASFGGGYMALRPGDVPFLGGGQWRITSNKTGIKACPAGNVIYASAVSGTPTIFLSGLGKNSIVEPIMGGCLVLDARQGQGGGTGNTGGSAHTNYVVGTVAIYIESTPNGRLPNIGITGYDWPFQLGNDAYCWDFYGYIAGNNHGWGFLINAGVTNSGERMFFQGTTSNNNYGIYADFTVLSYDLFASCRMDYNNQAQIKTVDPSGYNSTGSVMVNSAHIETSNQQSGIGPRIVNGGGLIQIKNSVLSEQGSALPTGYCSFTDATGASGMIQIIDNYVFAYNMVLCNQADTAAHNYEARGNRYRYSNAGVIFTLVNPAGTTVQEIKGPPIPLSGNGGQNYALEYQNRKAVYTAALGDTDAGLIIPTFASVPLPVGSTFDIYAGGNGAITFYPRAGVTVNGTLYSSDGAIYGVIPQNKPGQLVTLINVAANTFIYHSA